MLNLAQTIEENVTAALLEDLGLAITSRLSDFEHDSIIARDLTAQLIPFTQQSSATIITREPTIICGIPWATACFKKVDPAIEVDWHVREGDKLEANQLLCSVKGRSRSLLTAERTVLNFLQTLSATATATHRFVEAIKGTQARILDTRKTIPQLRTAQKYAVTIGGGMNQRLDLHAGILIKENHIAAAGSIEAVLSAAEKISKDTPIQIEVETLHQLECALNAGAKLILLDNFTLEALKKAVKLNQNRAILEASGGIDLRNVRAIAETGVDRISIGSLTKDVKAIDLSMRFIE